ncbi:predicted protein [Botrytis cinerea T4]|uniref:Uncharacterized protein n=1 Tax=Botryotinia fuckeliana (strain T4) TaxID=999810 RepID=G2Y6W2_BOTF4|nr:predicted protein [Botrytis cinerea T4]
MKVVKDIASIPSRCSCILRIEKFLYHSLQNPSRFKKIATS